MRLFRESVIRIVGGGLSFGGYWKLKNEWRNKREREGRIINVRNYKLGNVVEVKGSNCFRKEG